MKNKDLNPYAHLALREQLYLECRAMAEYALAKGKRVSPEAVKTIVNFEAGLKESAPGQNIQKNLPPDTDTVELVQIHSELAKAIEPALPQTILLLDLEQERASLFKFLGPVALVRHMMLAAIMSVMLFIGMAITQYVNTEGGNIFHSDGLPLLVNLIFFLSAAGLGGSFSALYKVNRFITAGTFDPTHQTSYWLRFFLGLIAGLILAIVISESAIESDLLEEGIIRPLLSILGGFSADLVYTFLNRMVESVRSLFQGSTDSIVESKTEEMRARFTKAQVQGQMQLAGDLMKIQQQIDTAAGPEEIRQKLNQLIDGLSSETK